VRFSLPAFEKKLATGLRGAYLIAGAEPLLVMEAADAVRRAARVHGFTEREVIDVEARYDWNDFRQRASAMGLFCQRQFFDLRMPSGKPGVEGSKALEEFCAAAPRDTLLLVTCGDWSRKHETAWFKAVQDLGEAIVFWPLRSDELPGWIEERMRSRGLAPTRDAVEYLALRVEGNLLAAAQEIDKLQLLHTGGALGLDAMQNLIADHARYDVFGLVDAIIAGDLLRVTRMVRGMAAEGEAIPPLLAWVAGLVQQLSRLLAAQGSGPAALSSAMGAERIWPNKQAAFKRALSRQSADALEKAILRSARVDRMSKGRERGDAWREFERLCLGLADPRLAQRLSA
jgi:DNA polymerase-3 subunit delta